MNFIGEYSGVLVISECENNEISEVSLELLGEGRIIADKLKVSLMSLLIGKKDKCKDLIEYGADIIYFFNMEKIKNYYEELDYITEIIKKYKPEIVLYPATLKFRSIAPRIASRLNTGLTADCTEFDIDDKTRNLIQIRPGYGGKLFAKIICPRKRPQMSTVRPKVMKKSARYNNRKGKIIYEDFELSNDYGIEVLETYSCKENHVNILKSDIIIAAGRGIGERKNLKLVFELAKLLNAAVGATRAIVDLKWIDYSHQIGQTGFTVSPKLYIACGISGASQHIVGMSSSTKVIAINSNEEAPIFDISDVVLVGDVVKILKEIISSDLIHKIN